MREAHRPRGAARRALAVRAVVPGVLALSLAILAAGCGGDSATGPDDGGGDGGDGGGSARTVRLSEGESAVIRGDDRGLRFSLPGPGTEGAAYRLAVQSAATSVGATPMRLAAETGEAASRTGASRRVARDGWRLAGGVEDPRGHRVRRRLQRRALEMLARRGIRPSDGRRDPRTRSMLPSGEVPRAGDQLTFWFPVEESGAVECDTDSVETVRATVQAVGERVAMVEGNGVDDGLTTEMDYEALAEEFDSSVFGTDVSYFGAPSDIDGNERVLVFFTNKVNELSAQLTDDQGGAVIAGFFIPADLADSGDPAKSGSRASTCDASNEAEIMWLLAPDPGGSTGETVTVDRATRLARSTSSHEFEHLLNLSNRLFDAGGGFGEAEDTWLDEGLAHLAEEIIGLDESGATLRDNLTLSEVTGTPSQDSIFNTFLLSDFGNLARYLQATASTRALAVTDPDETAESLQMRGFAWMFLRWLADRQHADRPGSEPGSGDPEAAFFRELAKADGSDLDTGVENVEGVTGRSWSELIADFALALAVDDDEPQAPDRHQVLTWDLRDVFGELHQASGSFPFNRPYPLPPTRAGFAADIFDFEVQGGTARYFALESDGAGAELTLEVTDQTGAPLTSGSPQVTIIRTD